MRYIFFLLPATLILITFYRGVPACSLPTPEGEIMVDGIKRTYLLDLPDKKTDKMPLLIALHGGFGSGEQAKKSYGLTPTAHQYGYAVVYPDGIPREGVFKIRTWNAGGCCGYAAKNNINDVKFISELIDTLVAEYAIDPDKIFVTGISNGAMMAYRLACEIPEKIRAIAPVAGSILPVATCGSAVAVIHFHSRKDENVPVTGGKGKGPSGYVFPSLKEVMNTWAATNLCTGLQSDTIEYEHYTVITYKNCPTEMDYYLTDDGGHSWPGADSKPRTLADDPSQAVDANELMFDFFKMVSAK